MAFSCLPSWKTSQSANRCIPDVLPEILFVQGNHASLLPSLDSLPKGWCESWWPGEFPRVWTYHEVPRLSLDLGSCPFWEPWIKICGKQTTTLTVEYHLGIFYCCLLGPRKWGDGFCTAVAFSNLYAFETDSNPHNSTLISHTVYMHIIYMHVYMYVNMSIYIYTHTHILSKYHQFLEVHIHICIY